MLNIDEIQNGVVIDHITAGTGLALYHMMELEKLDNASVALLQNVRSQKTGKKDIIKIEGSLDNVDLDVLGYLDEHITINIVKDNHIVEKKTLTLPKKITNVIHCKNPRCITSVEHQLPHIFLLADEEKRVYRCAYCEEAHS